MERSPDSREPNRIEELKKRLYSQRGPSQGHESYELHDEEHSVATDWKAPEIHETMHKKKKPLLNKILIFALLFFVVAVGFAFYAIQSNYNAVSSKNIDITVSGPTSISAGDPLSLNVSVRNRNDVSLEGVKLMVEYPQGTRSVGSLGEELTRKTFEIGTIPSGRSGEVTLDMVLFGAEGDVKSIKLGLEYRVPDSSALFYTEDVHEMEIGSSPLSLSISSPQRVSSGQIIEVEATISANTTEVIRDVILTTDYPFGFEFISASRTPTYDNDVWKLGDIAPGSSQTIRITGRLSGQQDEERTLRFVLGLESETDDSEVGTPFLSYNQTIVLEKPAINLSFLLGGQLGNEFIIQESGNMRADISWQNNLPSKVADASLRVDLTESLVDTSTISTSRGAYRPTAGSMIWDSRSSPEMQVINSGASGGVSFTFTPRDVVSLAGNLQEPELVVRITMSGTPLEGGTEPINISTVKTIKFATALDLESTLKYIEGEMPPSLNEETIYEVRWSLKNAVNHVSGAKVVATLPSYVRWVGEASPTSESVTFNSVGGQVIWDLGDIQAGAGYSRTGREVAFRVGVTPITGHVGKSPTVIGSAHASGTDTFVNKTVEDSVPLFTTDAGGNGTVVE